MKKAMVFLSVVLLVFGMLGKAGATVFNFEGLGLSEGDNVSGIMTTENSVFFSTNAGSLYAVQVGGPQNGFAPNDTPSGGNPGDFFLSDDFGVVYSYPYYISFATPVLSLSLDLYDYGDGPGSGNTATLNVFADHLMTQLVGTDSFTEPSPAPPDGHVVTLSVPAPTSNILAASLTYDPDAGTGIDNITFETVPVPGAIWLLGSGLIGLVAFRRRFKR